MAGLQGGTILRFGRQAATQISRSGNQGRGNQGGGGNQGTQADTEDTEETEETEETEGTEETGGGIDLPDEVSSILGRSSAARTEKLRRAKIARERQAVVRSRGGMKLGEGQQQIMEPQFGAFPTLMAGAVVDRSEDPDDSGQSMFLGAGLTPEKVKDGIKNIETKIRLREDILNRFDNERGAVEDQMKAMKSLLDRSGPQVQSYSRQGASDAGKDSLEGDYRMTHMRPAIVRPETDEERALVDSYGVLNESGVPVLGKEGTANLIRDYNKLNRFLVEHAAKSKLVEDRLEQLRNAKSDYSTMLEKARPDFETKKFQKPKDNNKS